MKIIVRTVFPFPENLKMKSEFEMYSLFFLENEDELYRKPFIPRVLKILI